ncbi:MAG: NF038130 family PEP-CTERM protein [Oscillatoria sp. PMC 1051.18]|nr:NF038130 family PEP-CTERM protein [Oscillatoria sp. PMC 1050.18]MEC5032042.1 NF038130 family PEP-CTERM protein [Oscillatoria sp. PMC 1051.18]
MKNPIKKILLGASVVVSVSAIATNSAWAGTLKATNIEFNTDNFQTYNGPDNSDISQRDEAQAIQALTDDSLYTNVELWAFGEDVLENVGFSANLGSHQVTVETVTGADWAIFGQQWLDDFLGAYNLTNVVTANQYQQALTSLTTLGRPRSGDPNISNLTLNEETGEIEIGLIGHYDLTERLTKPEHFHTWQSDPIMYSVKAFLDGGFIPGPIQISEIAKVTVDGEVNWVYSFNAVETNTIAADAKDKTSHTGYYSKTIKVASNEPGEKVPEPSALLGLVVVGGVFATRGKFKKV